MNLSTKSLLIAFSLLFVACGKSSTVGEQNSTAGKIFSNRPQNQTKIITLLKLKSPALLSTASKKDGVTVYNQDLLKLVNAEQEAMEKKLAELSKEIKVIRKYKLVLNALAVIAPIELSDDLSKVAGVSAVEENGLFAPAEVTTKALNQKEDVDLSINNSVSFIGADKVHSELGVKGEGITVGIIDSGIDYTHAMFGGVGTPEAFKAIDPNGEAVGFPNDKVVGGIDLVGKDYSPSSPVFERQVPKPDNNPIDEGGHGTHVAGSVAGIGDGKNTYDGVAPKAKLHAIKVFGAGSTTDMIVIAALEYAADPNGDLDLKDKLDVVNLSLGGGYGKPHIMYSEAVKNLVNGGVVTVASAGNSGHNPYIVGAPSTAADAISVAASVDNMQHNINFKAVAFVLADAERLLVEAIEGDISTPIDDAGKVMGKLVPIGTAAIDLTDEQKEAVKGNVALIDRGEVTFVEKLKRAHEAGAIGVIVANNQPGAAIAMGGDEKVALPAIMVTKAIGDKLKEDIKKGETSVEFKTNEVIKKPELVDTLTNFSSRGPRSMDSLLKPEIAAPGFNIISAAMGKGAEGVQMSGTSMSGPHVAGVMALLVQKHKDLTTRELKSVLLNTAKSISNAKNENYPVSMQGAGRVQVFKAATAKLITTPSTLSLGEFLVETKKAMRKTLEVKNITDKELKLNVESKAHKNVEVKTDVTSLTLAAGESKKITLTFIITAPKTESPNIELDGLVLLKTEDEETARVPFIAVASRVSSIKTEALKVYSTSSEDAAGSAVDLTLKNHGKNQGQALIFNLLGRDKRKHRQGDLLTRSRACDLEVAGYRVIEKTVQGEPKQMLQVGIKLYNPVSMWQPCEISVLVDGNGDNIADQELAGVMHSNLAGLTGQAFNSFLLNAERMRKLRAAYEAAHANPDVTEKPQQNYQTAIIGFGDMKFYNQSTISMIEADVSLLTQTASGELALKLAVSYEDPDAVEADDFLGTQTDPALGEWIKINLSEQALSYTGMPELVELKGKEAKTLSLSKGEGSNELLILYPQNRSLRSHTGSDKQSETPLVQFQF